MFTPLGLFKNSDCPQRLECHLPNCVFAHSFQASKSVLKTQGESTPQNGDVSEGTQNISDGPRKKRRLNNGHEMTSEVSRQASHNGNTSAVASATARTASKSLSPPPLHRATKNGQTVSQNTSNGATGSILRPSPQNASLSLNPRMLPNPPAPHAIRMQLIKLLHDQMLRLNDEIKQTHGPNGEVLTLSDNDIILAALEEEESAAKDNPAVYANIIKLRIVKLKKMKVADWKLERLSKIAKSSSHSTSTVDKPKALAVGTGLSSDQEIAFLSRLFAKQNGLEKFGYVEKSPNQPDIEQARKGLEAAKGWEQCDRCQTRFQVFPGRRAEDGALTSGGLCTYHPAKPRRPVPKDKADKVSRELQYACCSESQGSSAGCTTAASHVFKVSDPKRLALIMPFEKTPENPRMRNMSTAVCFDCEMGYTTLGLELIRLTATSWPSGKELLDVIVRPIGEILDLNSRFSGVFPKDFAHDDGSTEQGEGDVPSSNLPILDSPSAARSLLFSHLAPSTPLIGHALDNDLNSVRIIHPSIVDTVLLYPHPRGLPVRFGLKMLLKKHLDRDIQMGGAAGHDSKEDARAAGELVSLRVTEAWQKMKSEGWRAEGPNFLSPMTRAEAMKADIAEAKANASAGK